MSQKYDVVWYWVGDRKSGEWRETLVSASSDLDALVWDIECQGYVAVKGRRSIGRPEGAPPEDRFVAVGV